jgi:hypothetical protein
MIVGVLRVTFTFVDSIEYRDVPRLKINLFVVPKLVDYFGV